MVFKSRTSMGSKWRLVVLPSIFVLTFFVLLILFERAFSVMDKVCPSLQPLCTMFAAVATSTPNTFPVPPTQENYKNVEDIQSRTLAFGIAAGGGLSYHDQEYLDQYFKQLKDLGVEWVRWDVDWSRVQSKNSEQYDWTSIDRVAATAMKYNIYTLGIITYAPEWARQAGCKSDYRCAPADPEAFGKFSGMAAARYKGVINTWEIWNEPNMTKFWGLSPDVLAYGKILKSSYIQIKTANPKAFVLSGGLASVGDSNKNMSPLTFVKKLYVNEYQGYFDAVALHPYTYPALPSYKAWWNRWQQIVPIHQLMVTNGDEEKKIWITEFGVPTGGPGKAYFANQLNEFRYGVDFMYENSQRYLMTDATNFYRQHIDWMGPFFWYSLKDSSNERSTSENFFGLLRYDGSKKPSYDLLKQLIASSTAQ